LSEAVFIAVLPLVVRDNYHASRAGASHTGHSRLLGRHHCRPAIAFCRACAPASPCAGRSDRRSRFAARIAWCWWALASLPPFPVFVALNFIWGLGAGITMTQSRTIIQIVAPATHRPA
jgi:hypothetical protein